MTTSLEFKKKNSIIGNNSSLKRSQSTALEKKTLQYMMLVNCTNDLIIWIVSLIGFQNFKVFVLGLYLYCRSRRGRNTSTLEYKRPWLKIPALSLTTCMTNFHTTPGRSHQAALLRGNDTSNFYFICAKISYTYKAINTYSFFHKWQHNIDLWTLPLSLNILCKWFHISI